jgi:hypothetical protein
MKFLGIGGGKGKSSFLSRIPNALTAILSLYQFNLLEQ